MRRFNLVPGAPVLRLSQLRGRAPLRPPTGFWFSFERYALIHYLEFVSSRRDRPVKTVLCPDYMCHEVIQSLRDHGFGVEYYPLESGFRIDPGRIEERIDALGGAPAALIVVDFYGRMVRNLAEIASLCEDKGVHLIEDCAHLPYPFPGPEREAPCEARFYTFRKVYGVPYGSTAALKDGQEGFNRFVEEKVERRPDGSASGVAKWVLRELGKKLVIESGLPYRREYRDLSQDPLKPYNFSHPWVERMLPEDEALRSVERRRANCRAYAEMATLFEGWAEPLDFDLERDVPYQLLLLLREGLSPLELIEFFLANGVSAVRGLALHPEVLSGLPGGHPYRRQVALPLHQDVSSDDIGYVRDMVRRFKKRKRI
ncbi:MAG: DegT/DnrJ/EryC1/StrS family aminotransferase [Elusimicrobiota bacterium]